MGCRISPASEELMRMLEADPVHPLTPSEYYHCCMMVGFARTRVGQLAGTGRIGGCDYPFDDSRPLDDVATLMCTEIRRRGLRMCEDTIVSMTRDLVNRDGTLTRRCYDLMNLYCDGGFRIIRENIGDDVSTESFLRLCIVCANDTSED